MLLLHGCGTLIAPEFQKTHSSSTEVTEVESGGWQASVALYTGTSVRLLKRRIIKFSPWSAGRYRRDNGRLVVMVRCLGSVWGVSGDYRHSSAVFTMSGRVSGRPRQMTRMSRQVSRMSGQMSGRSRRGCPDFQTCVQKAQTDVQYVQAGVRIFRQVAGNSGHVAGVSGVSRSVWEYLGVSQEACNHSTHGHGLL